ncbi:MAG: hypothetical protein IT319_02730 [Anaerolineae bacterium]|nr:hypothetical protein [Anaerolineae bacterium]
MTAPRLSENDWQVRHFVYTFFVENEIPPSLADAANRFQITEAEARLAYHRLNDAHALFLNPGTDQIRMANPLSAMPTNFRVHTRGKRLWANCAWDSLGIPAMLHADALIEAAFSPSGERVTYAIEDGKLQAPGALIHFPLPFSQWYDDLIDT